MKEHPSWKVDEYYLISYQIESQVNSKNSILQGWKEHLKI